MNVPKDKKLYDKVKAEADKKYDKPSAYKSGWIVKEYKKRGGEYLGKKKKDGLTRWFKEKWEDVGGKDYPVYRPTKRVSKDTPLTPKEIDPKDLEKQIKLKQKIKGESNLPPFKKISGNNIDMKGGKISSADLQLLLKTSYKPETLTSEDDYEIDKDLSTLTTKVIRKKGTDEAFVVHRGSYDATDAYDNFQFVKTGYYDNARMKEARAVQKTAEKKYGSKNVSTLGHSKGGYYASELGRNSKEIITLNRPTHISDLVYKVPEKQTDIRSSYDPVSFLRPLQRGNKAVTIPSESMNLREEHGVPILERKPNKIYGVGLLQHICYMNGC